MKYKIMLKNLKYMINSPKYKTILLSLICLNLYGTIYLAHNMDYISGIIQILTNPYYIIILLLMILINLFITVQNYDENTFYIIRFKTKEEYLKNLITNVIVSTIVLSGLNLIILIIGLNIFAPKLVIESILNYQVANIIYCLFYIFRFYLLIQLLTIINLLLLKLLDSKIVLIINIVFYLSFLLIPYSFSTQIQNVSKMYFVYVEYFRLHYYSSFTLELLCSCIYLLLGIMLLYVLFFITKRNFRKIGT